jgi:hypothetical protein
MRTPLVSVVALSIATATAAAQPSEPLPLPSDIGTDVDSSAALPPPAEPVVVAPPVLEAPLPAPPPPPPLAHDDKKRTPWYEKINLRGYSQFRYNRLPSLRVNDDLINRQGDRSIGRNGGFLIRRARLILFGDVHERVGIYLQPDFASSIGDQGGVAILRDWYADIFFDKEKQFRVRVGQSKVPYGFENLQSSQNRLPLDRNDALNSAVKDERDLGAFFYWSPPKYRRWFKQLVDDGLKGSGDYGIVGVGVSNGQTANSPTDNQPHVIGRVALPFKIGDQFFEVGGGGYYGKYTLNVQNRSDLAYTIAGGDNEIVDTRAFATVVVYPQPLGFTAEYTVGRGPQQGRNTPTLIDSLWLHGGYAQLHYKIDNPLGMVALIPFARGTYYDGGKKFVTNAPHYEVKELELGLEAQIHKALEVVLAYDITERTSDAFPHATQFGHVTRVQVQVNY